MSEGVVPPQTLAVLGVAMRRVVVLDEVVERYHLHGIAEAWVSTDAPAWLAWRRAPAQSPMTDRPVPGYWAVEVLPDGVVEPGTGGVSEETLRAFRAAVCAPIGRVVDPQLEGALRQYYRRLMTAANRLPAVMRACERVLTPHVNALRVLEGA